MPTRVTEEQQESKKQEIGKLELHIERWSRFDKGKNSDLWKELGPIIKTAKEEAEAAALRAIRTGDPKDDYRARLLAGEAQGYQHILTDVDDAEKKIEKARERISILKQALRAAKENRVII